MDEILEEFDEYVDGLTARLRAGALSGVDGERAQSTAVELIREYRSKLEAEELPSRGRELLEEFKREAARL